MTTLPTGLRTYEPNETVRRISQNDNIEATDALFHDRTGHQHTGRPGDAPQIDSEGIAASAVTTEKLAGLSITSEKIAALSVTADKLAAASVNADKIASASITTDKLALSSVNSERLAALSVTGDKLASGAVTKDKMALGCVTADRLSQAAVTGEKMANASVSLDKLANASVNTDKITASAVTTDKLATGSVTTDKLAASSVTKEKLGRNQIERQHVRGSELSSNIAKYQSVSITGGQLYGNPTTPFLLDSDGMPNNVWSLARSIVLPQSLTIELGQTYRGIEGMSIGSLIPNNPGYMPKNFIVEGTKDTTWTLLYTHNGTDLEPFSYIPFTTVGDWQRIRITITERRDGTNPTEMSSIAVYSRSYGDLDKDVLNDIRPWGLNARLQGMMIIPEGNVNDNGTGLLSLSAPLIVMNPASGTFFRINPGSFQLENWGYLYVDIPRIHGAATNAYKSNWTDGIKDFAYKNRIVLAQRAGSGNIYFHAALQARLFGLQADADKVDGLHFRASNGFLEYSSDGAGWKGVGIKSVQRGKTNLTSGEFDNFRYIPLSAVNLSKTFVNIHHSGLHYQRVGTDVRYSDTSIYAEFTSNTQLVISSSFANYLYYDIMWEVIEFA